MEGTCDIDKGYTHYVLLRSHNELDNKCFCVQLPAQSLAWEPAEANVMARPPRDIATERLVSFPLLCHAYLIVGGMQSLFSFLAWIWVYHHNGVATKDIFLLDPKDGIWLSRAENGDGNIAFSRGRPFSPEEQEDIVRQVCICIQLGELLSLGDFTPRFT